MKFLKLSIANSQTHDKDSVWMLWKRQIGTILIIGFISRQMPNKGGISTHLVSIKGSSFFPSKDVKTTKKIYSSLFLLCRVTFFEEIILRERKSKIMIDKRQLVQNIIIISTPQSGALT